VKETKIYLLKNEATKKWCSFTREPEWRKAVENAGSMSVGTLTYAGRHLSQVDVSETDQTGDWTAYDHYFLNTKGEPSKLVRLINVLPGDTSVLQSFSITNSRATKTATTLRQLSTGRPATSAPDWIPELPIATRLELFPFNALLKRSDSTMRGNRCVQVVEALP
jgi:hypothetical protein